MAIARFESEKSFFSQAWMVGSPVDEPTQPLVFIPAIEVSSRVSKASEAKMEFGPSGAESAKPYEFMMLFPVSDENVRCL